MSQYLSTLGYPTEKKNFKTLPLSTQFTLILILDILPHSCFLSVINKLLNCQSTVKNVITCYILFNNVLTLKAPNKMATDDILIFYCCLSKKIRLDFSCESSAQQRIHLKHQVLFSLKNNEKNIYECRNWCFKGLLHCFFHFFQNFSQLTGLHKRSRLLITPSKYSYPN